MKSLLTNIVTLRKHTQDTLRSFSSYMLPVNVVTVVTDYNTETYQFHQKMVFFSINITNSGIFDNNKNILGYSNSILLFSILQKSVRIDYICNKRILFGWSRYFGYSVSEGIQDSKFVSDLKNIRIGFISIHLLKGLSIGWNKYHFDNHNRQADMQTAR